METPADLFALIASASHRARLPILAIGGHAVNAYGYARTTLDADFMIAEDDLPRWRRLLEDTGCTWQGQTQTFARFAPRPEENSFTSIDLMLMDRATFDALQADSRELAFGQSLLPVPAPLHLIALKLHAMRNQERRKLGKDLADIAHLVRTCGMDVRDASFQAIIDRHADEKTRRLLDDLFAD